MSASHLRSLGIVIRAAARTDVGRVRERNEDRYLLADLATKQRALEGKVEVTSAGLLLGVCDGMGGAAAGDVASFIATDIITTHMERNGTDTEPAFARELVRAVEAADVAIANDAIDNAKRHGMGTTCTVAGCCGRTLFLGQIGDSRAYLLRQGVLTQVTRDQTLVGELVAMGSMTPEAALTSTRANIILQALGRGKSLNVDLTSLELRRGDRLLLCSDGLTKMVKDAEIARELDTEADLDACCAKLVSLANEAGGSDNITVVLCEFDGEGLAEPTERDVIAYAPHVFASEAPVVDEPKTEQPAEPTLRIDPVTSAGPAPSLFPKAPARRWRNPVLAAAVLLCILLLAFGSWEDEPIRPARVAHVRIPAARASAARAAAPARPHEERDEAHSEPSLAPAPAVIDEPFESVVPAVVSEPRKRGHGRGAREKVPAAPYPHVLPWSQRSKVAEDPFR